MHRRQFLRAAAGSLIFPASVAKARQAATPAGTPAPPPHHGSLRPIVLGDGIELIDYRIFPSDDVPRIIGEITNTRDDMIDSPVISITFPDLGSDGLAWAPPLLPVMRPGASNMIFGVLPRGVTSDVQLEEATFGLCGPVVSGPMSDLQASLQLRIELLREDRWENVQYIEAAAHNDGAEVSIATKVKGLVRGPNGRYVGAIPEIDLWWIDPGNSITFGVWNTADQPTAANPFVLLGGSDTYATELFSFSMGTVVSPGCPSLWR